MRRWLAQAEVDDGTRPGITTEESAEVKRLKAENKRLREDNEILRRASIFFGMLSILSDSNSSGIKPGPIHPRRGRDDHVLVQRGVGQPGNGSSL